MMGDHVNFRSEVRDVLEKHNPLQTDCISHYDKVITDLLRYWQYDDEPADVKEYLQGLFVYHCKKFTDVEYGLVHELFKVRGKRLK